MEIVYSTHSFSISSLLIAFKNMYSGNSWDHMWFIYMIVGLYIITPPLKIIINHADKYAIRYLLFILFIFLCLIPLIDELTGVNFGISIPINSIYLFYYILGYAIHREIIGVDVRLNICFLIIGITWFIIGQFIPSIVIYDPNLNFKFAKYFGLLLSTAIFSLAKAKCSENTNYIDTKIVPLSLGVYIIHQIFLNILYKVLQITPEYYNIWFCWFVVFSITSICSLLFVWILRKIPFVRKWVL